jgi:Protein of unknown function (DUF1279)
MGNARLLYYGKPFLLISLSLVRRPVTAAPLHCHCAAIRPGCISLYSTTCSFVSSPTIESGSLRRYLHSKTPKDKPPSAAIEPELPNKKEAPDVYDPSHLPPSRLFNIPFRRSNLFLKMSNFLREYGKLGVAIYIIIAATTFSFFYFCVKFGLDVKSWLNRVGVSLPGWAESAGDWILVYALYKLTLPIRLTLTVTMTPLLGRYFKYSSPPK